MATIPTNVRPKVDRNVEFAHVKAEALDMELSLEHKISCNRLKVLLRHIEQEEKEDWCTVVLVDDYNSVLQGKRSVDRPFFQALKKEGCQIDFVAWESRLNASVPILLESIKQERREKMEDRLRRNTGIPCSWHVAIWNLVRLGVLPLPEGLLEYPSSSKKPFVGEAITTILPDTYYYRHFEGEGEKILYDSIFSYSTQLLDHVYFEYPNGNGNEHH